jgi:hypothetical protein
MRQMLSKSLPACLLLIGAASRLAAQTAPAQTLAPELAQMSGRVESYIREKKPGWKHETTPPPTPPGYKPSPNVVVHFWSSDKCMTAELKVDGANYGARPVPCMIHLAIYQAASAAEALRSLDDSITHDRGERFEPFAVGDKGYLRNGNAVVFVKGRFTFWLDGRVELSVGRFSIDCDFIERMAKDISDSVGSI